MKVIRARNPIAVDYMKDHLLDESSDYGIENLVDGIKAALADYPEDTFLLQAWDDKTLAGFLLAFNLPQQKHVFFQQVWVDAKYPGLSDKMFFRLVVWVDNLGKREIRGETHRNVGVLEKRWGFRPFSRIVSFEIPEDYESKLLEKSHNILIGDKENEQKQSKNTDGAAADGEPEGSGQAVKCGHSESTQRASSDESGPCGGDAS